LNRIGEKGAFKDIPDATVREQARQMLAQGMPSTTGPNSTSVQKRIVINGVTYNCLDEIQDPRLRHLVEVSMKKAEAEAKLPGEQIDASPSNG
jgi:hypothetical protein